MEKVGPSIRFTEVQMQKLWATFVNRFIDDRTTDDYKWVARWLRNGQPWVKNGEVKRPGGHTLYVKIWKQRGEAIIVLWQLIHECMEAWTNLDKAQIRGYERRQRFIEEHFNLNLLELCARVR